MIPSKEANSISTMLKAGHTSTGIPFLTIYRLFCEIGCNRRQHLFSHKSSITNEENNYHKLQKFYFQSNEVSLQNFKNQSLAVKSLKHI